MMRKLPGESSRDVSSTRDGAREPDHGWILYHDKVDGARFYHNVFTNVRAFADAVSSFYCPHYFILRMIAAALQCFCSSTCHGRIERSKA